MIILPTFLIVKLLLNHILFLCSSYWTVKYPKIHKQNDALKETQRPLNFQVVVNATKKLFLSLIFSQLKHKFEQMEIRKERLWEWALMLSAGTGNNKSNHWLFELSGSTRYFHILHFFYFVFFTVSFHILLEQLNHKSTSSYLAKKGQ